MAHKRKIIDTFEIRGNYGAGWDCVTTELTLYDAKNQLRVYNENEPQYAHTIKLVREPYSDELAAAVAERQRENERERNEKRAARKLAQVNALDRDACVCDNCGALMPESQYRTGQGLCAGCIRAIN